MDYSDSEIEIQEKFWILGVTEMSLTYSEVEELLNLIKEKFEEGMSGDEMLVLHFSSKPSAKSHKHSFLQLPKLLQLLEVSIEARSRHSFTDDRIRKARELIEYYDLNHGILRM
jgi:hypothetical protein